MVRLALALPVFNYFENYAPDDSCVIKLAFLVTLDVKDFRNLMLWNTLVVYSQNYSGSTGPVSVEADSEISFSQMELVERRLVYVHRQRDTSPN